MAGDPAFHLFRFPIHIRPGFLMFMALVVFINPNEFGLWLAGSAAVLTLVHELGHGFAARATGAEAEISLDLLAGYASFVPVRGLKRWERAGISLAGPAVQILTGVALVMALGAHPFDVQLDDSAAVQAIRWTGLVMGLLNLVPVLPLDGGNIAMAGLDVLLPGRSRTPMLWISVGITVVGAAYLLTSPRYRGLGIFAVFPLLVQLQMLTASSPRRKPDRATTAGAAGEARAWATGDVTEIPEGYVPSPWFRAYQQLCAGEPEVARGVLLERPAAGEAPNWWMPTAAPREALATLVHLLPTPLPHVSPYHDAALATILQRVGRHEDAVRFSAESFATTRRALFALLVAQSAAALGDRETAIAWLGAAAQAADDPGSLGEQIDALPELADLRPDPRFAAIRAGLREV